MVITGKINEPVKLTSQVAGNWVQISGPSVILRIELDQKSCSFIPSQNGTYKFNHVNESFEVQVGTVTPTPTPEPTPTPTGAKYDSNIQGKWANGTARFVTDREGNVGADGFGFTVNASGGGGFRIDGKGQGNLEPASAGHRRIYIACRNYNARLEGEFAFLDSKPRNASIKTRSRHQYADEVDSNAPDSKKQGGLGIHFDIEKQQVGFQYETVHGTNGGDKDLDLPKNLEVGKWYKFKYTYKDASSSTVNIKVELDYGDGQGFKTVMDFTPSVPNVFFVKSDFDTWSQFWLRLNDEGKIGWKNVRLYPI